MFNPNSNSETTPKLSSEAISNFSSGFRSMSNLKVDLDKLVYRPAIDTDDATTISDQIYQSDPYIYPYWFNGNEDDARFYFNYHFGDVDHPFSFMNCFVAYEDVDPDGELSDSVLGTIVGWRSEQTLRYDFYNDTQDSSQAHRTIETYLKPALFYAYGQPSRFLTIYAFSVADGYRSKGIGGRLLENYLTYMKKTYKIHHVRLTCLEANYRARNFYKKHRFKAVDNSIGFNGFSETQPKVIIYQRDL